MSALQNKSGAAGRSKFALTETQKQRLTREYESNPVSSGRTQYLRYLKGEKLTYMEAVHAKCAECCGGYVDGRHDCGISACPLYQFMPYKGQFDSETQEGGVSHE